MKTPTPTLKERAPKTRWLRPGDIPVSITLLKHLIREGLITSYVLTTPGSRRPIRFIDAESFNRWVMSGKEGA
jgi:hypothetical protein